MNRTKDLRKDSRVNQEDMFDLADKFILAVKSQNWDKLRLIITRDCIWKWPGRGTGFGSEFAIDEFSQMANQVGNIKLKKVLYKLSGVAISFHLQMIMIGVESDEKICIVCTLRQNLISEIDANSDFVIRGNQ